MCLPFSVATVDFRFLCCMTSITTCQYHGNSYCCLLEIEKGQQKLLPRFPNGSRTKCLKQ